MKKKVLWLNEDKLAIVISISIFIIYMNMLFSYIYNDGFSFSSFSKWIFIIAIFYIIKNKFFKIDKFLLLFCLSGFLLITLKYLFLGYGDIPSGYKTIIKQYIWFVPLCLLPIVYYFSKFKEIYFFNTLIIPTSFLFLYNIYHLFRLNFNRGELSSFFNPIISYDIGFISICLLLFCYAFYLKGKRAYFVMFLSLITMFSLILHGSRGTWIAIPIVIGFVTCIYFKSQLKKSLTAVSLFLILLCLSLFLPNSPIINRIDHFKADAQSIEIDQMHNSTGTRLLLWQNSIELFKKAPILGVGAYEIEKENCRLYELKKLALCYHHQHNIFFHELAANGILGILSLLLTFGISSFYFLRHLSKSDIGNKFLALTGLVFVFYYFICGMTEYYLFFLNTTYLFYFVVSSLMSFIYINNKLGGNNNKFSHIKNLSKI